MSTQIDSLTSQAKDHGFTLVSEESLPEIDGNAYVLNHDASGAKLLYLQNNDPNKAFSISFKTPAADDTGTFHILEHSVLCGSDKFPVKEPFVNLLKSSMQTFLNAMTFPDKTMYPVASTNEQDLLNLMDVYMDAVFHPAIYTKPAIFEQEGWHLELADSSDEEAQKQAGETIPFFNGVVFNEMKGALSEPDSILYDALSAALFPDTTYAFESGGTPAAIPTLTYEAFLDNHRRHYRTDNSFITLYGNMNIDEVLGFLDDKYLTPLTQEQAAEAPGKPNPLDLQEPLVSVDNTVTMATTPENSAMALGYVVGTAHERERVLAAGILLDALMASNESPLKRALLDAKLADDVQAFLSDSVAQPFIMLQIKGIHDNGASRFKDVVTQTIQQLVTEGINRDFLEAALARSEFVMREGNFGMADGVVYAMTALSGWLYNDEDATTYLRYNDAFADLRQKLDTPFFEELAQELFLTNNHYAAVELIPIAQLSEDPVQAQLNEITQSFGPQDYASIREDVAALRAIQEAEDTPEALATLPSLSLSSLEEAPEEPSYHLSEDYPLPALIHNLPTNGIEFIYQYFNLEGLTFDELPYATLLSMVLGKLDTAHYSAAQLASLVRSKLGNLSFFTEVHEDIHNRHTITPTLGISTSALEHNATWCPRLVKEVCLTSNFADTDKIHDVLLQKRIAMEQDIMNSGNSAAMGRVASYYLPAGVLREQMSGIDFYYFLKDLLAHYDERAEELSQQLHDVAERIFVEASSLVSFAGTPSALDSYFEVSQEAEDGSEASTANTQSPAASAYLGVPKAQAPASRLNVPAPVKKNEAFVVPSDVTYTAMGYDRRLLDVPYEGAWLLASRALSYDYLWNEVRVKGGAYGAGFQATRPGSLRFYTYRDPHIDQSVARFKEAGSWLSSYSPSAQEYDGFKISTVASLDSPAKARVLLRRQDGDFFSHSDPNLRAALREEVIEAPLQSVCALGNVVTEVTNEDYLCTVGNGAVIEESKLDLHVIDLFGQDNE